MLEIEPLSNELSTLRNKEQYKQEEMDQFFTKISDKYYNELKMIKEQLGSLMNTSKFEQVRNKLVTVEQEVIDLKNIYKIPA